MPKQHIKDLGEDATGFGAAELRTIWHSVIRPVQVLEAYMTGGPTGHGQYGRPLRLYLALSGVLMVIQFLMGGLDSMFANAMSDEALAPLLEIAGKSRDAFIADADGWGSFFTVPFLAIAYALAVAPLLRLWDPEDLGWRRAFRATFAYLNNWTVLILPVGWMVYVEPLRMIGMLLITGLGIVAFIRMGKGRWWRTRAGATLKGLGLAATTLAAAGVASIPLSIIAILGGLFGA